MWIAVILSVFALSMLTMKAAETVMLSEEQEIRKETYISNLNDTYTTNIEQCRQSVTDAGKDKPAEEIQKAVTDGCITPINKSRTATLLVKWGHGDLLVTQ
jgi:uncharacterized protein YpmB